jgi:hypothetical protein
MGGAGIGVGYAGALSANNHRTFFMSNPSLRWQLRTERSPFVEFERAETLLNWLERTGRFMELPVEIDPKLLEDNALDDVLDNCYDIAEEEDEDQEF